MISINRDLEKFLLNWRQIGDVLPDLISIMDTSYRIVYLNNTMAQKLGVSREEVLGITCYNAVHKQNKPPAYCPLRKLLDNGRDHSSDIFDQNLGGHYQVVVSPIRGEDSRLIGAVHMARNINKLKKTEEELRKNQERYQDILDEANDLIQSVAPDGSLLYVNRTWRKTMGYSEEEVSGLKLWDIVPRSCTEHCRALFQETLNGKNLEQIQVTFVTKDGRELIMEGNSSCKFKDGKPVASRGIFRDITRRFKAEAALRQSEKKFRTLVENINMGIYRNTGGPHGRFIEANPAIVKMFGYDSVDEFMNTSVSDLYQHPEDRVDFIRDILKSGHIKNRQINLKKKDGTTFWAACTATAHFHEDNELEYIDGVIEDITEQKKLEAQVQQVQKLESLGVMAGGIAHDFNNLLMG
ncbi:MAG TPA: PAS domain-containing sensor histidine kinase, partial [Thermodesulfobacteriaceae bacterium]|nr:PAS domain-containing sensor histidine kinase [Thermodesulfobacteriaceae bacterium]